MANCTATQVRLIINTSMIDADVTALITLADQEITDRGLTARPASQLQRLSMFITASMVAFRDPSSRSIGDYKDALRGPSEYRREADRIMMEEGEILLKVTTDDIE